MAGESAGAASIVHHITARGGRGKPPAFQQALIQSAGWNPSVDSSHLETLYHQFLNLLKVKTLQQARRVSSLDLRNANFLAAVSLSLGELGFGKMARIKGFNVARLMGGTGVEPDGEYVPEAPAKLLRDGKFHRGIRLMVGQNAAEVGFLAFPMRLF